eukprot:CAMPEP_0202692766 /NCGR_PEP_ID=MMETSP1385-20130828/7073_1 /ASSEMBLY_ACC=CAM_ASM_000861 /TAXON_ID=933848 /ORGANISM="Elphidium margaritaceum" /LENGTH=541 /DNA_ID=CAMNT_0049348359 /DNA_START=27 /DNA_END=1652 /DNA_ORIENTATION=-
MERFVDRVITIGGTSPRQVAKTVLLLFLFGYATGRFTRSVLRHGLRRTLYYAVFLAWKQYKGDSGYQQEMTEARQSFRHSLYPEAVKNTAVNKTLPTKSVPSHEILKTIEKWSQYEEELWNGKKRQSSGAVYHGGKTLSQLQNQAYALFSIANPLHPDVFPFTRKMESEILAMTVSYFNGNPYKQRGLVTNGGTESISMAVRAYKNWALQSKSIYHPELIVAQSAHSAFMKACEMFEVQCIVVPVDANTFTVKSATVRRYITANTIAIVGSAPQYAQGVLDPILELSKLALEYQIGLHVDCCLGSLLMPTLQRMGYEIPPFDFRVPGVTSISADTHKFGYCQKGTSVVMFRDNALRRHAYFTESQSSIGLYCTPTIQGSRSGGVIASAWACMMHMGEEGYQREAKLIMDAVSAIKQGVDAIDGLCVAGNPVMSVVGIVSTGALDVYHVSSAMSKRGWTLNNCKDPPCAHICVTRANCMLAKAKFVEDLRESVADVEQNPKDYEKCDGAMYGVMVALPDTSAQSDIMHEYLDVMLGLVDETK